MSLIFICFDSSQIFLDIASLNFQVSWGHQFLTEVKQILDFGIFWLGLSNFWVGASFPFDIFQSSLGRFDEANQGDTMLRNVVTRTLGALHHRPAKC